jgi:hypothetical protein
VLLLDLRHLVLEGRDPRIDPLVGLARSLVAPFVLVADFVDARRLENRVDVLGREPFELREQELPAGLADRGILLRVRAR